MTDEGKDSGVKIRAPAAQAGPAPGGSFRRRLPAFLIGTSVILLGLFFFSFLVPPAQAAPAFVNSWSAGSATTTGSQAVTVATTAGDTVVVTTATKLSATTVSSIADNAAGGSSVYTRKVGPVANTVGFEVWGTAVGAAKAATTITVTFSDSSSKVAVAVGDYSGVTNYGNTNTGTGSGANPGAIAVTVQEANGAIAGGFATNDGTAQTALTGNLRQAPVATGGSASTRVGDSLVDLLSQTAGSHSLQTTHATIAWAGGVIELRNQTPCTVAPSIAYNNGQTQVGWAPATATEGPDGATGQTSGSSAITVTNNGPGSCNIQIAFFSSFTPPTGTEVQWSATGTAPGVGVNDISLTPATVCATIASGATCNIWLWSRFTNAQAGSFPATPGSIFTITEA